MVINRNVGWPNLNLGGALTKSGVRQRICRSISVYLHGVYLGYCPLSRIFLGTIVTLMEPPFLSSRIGLTISAPVLPLSDAKHCSRSRKRLQPPLQSIATIPANVCGKSLHLASVPASTCIWDRLNLGISPMFFLQSQNGSVDIPWGIIEPVLRHRCPH